MLIIANITPINLNVVNHILGVVVILTLGKIRLIFCNVSLAAYILSMEQLSNITRHFFEYFPKIDHDNLLLRCC